MWVFDSSVASRFQEEATKHIPDYQRVIDLCLSVAKFKQHQSIIDVGCALGYTQKVFIDSGFNIDGVDNSESMLKLNPYNTICSDKFPNHKLYDMVLINWTLHFILDKEDYLVDVYTAMSDNSTLIISDKTNQSEAIKQMYYDFKKQNGITDLYIQQKENDLKGVMHTLPVDWYLTTLNKIGFKNIQIINGKYGFVTFYAEK